MEVIRFQCPACAANLTVPPAAAGFRGPCPRCSIEIIGPDPAKGLPALLPADEPPEEPGKRPEESSTADDPFAGSSLAEPPPEVSWPEPKEPTDEAKAPEEREVTRPAPATTQTNASRPAGVSAAVLVLSCMLCAVLAYVLGYTRGNKEPEAESPVFATLPPEVPENKPVDIPVRDWIQTAEHEDPAPPKPVGPEATLKTFLDADNWKARSAYVMFPDQLKPRMEARARKVGNGPIEVVGISRLHITEDSHIFNVSTTKFPAGFPVAVTRDNDGWSVDWETFVEFHDDRFKDFAVGQENENGIFHLMVNPVESGRDDELFASFRLSPPMPDRERLGYVRKGSLPHARLNNIFKENAGLPETDFRKLLDGAGPPMILALSYKTNSQGQSFIQIEDVVAVGWGPGEP